MIQLMPLEGGRPRQRVAEALLPTVTSKDTPQPPDGEAVGALAGVERVPVHIPGVEIVGDFPIKRFLETIYNAAAKQYGVKLNATILPVAEDRRVAERGGEHWPGGGQYMKFYRGLWYYRGQSFTNFRAALLAAWPERRNHP